MNRNIKELCLDESVCAAWLTFSSGMLFPGSPSIVHQLQQIHQAGTSIGVATTGLIISPDKNEQPTRTIQGYPKQGWYGPIIPIESPLELGGDRRCPHFGTGTWVFVRDPSHFRIEIHCWGSYWTDCSCYEPYLRGCLRSIDAPFISPAGLLLWASPIMIYPVTIMKHH